MKKPGWLVWLALGTAAHTYNFDAVQIGALPPDWLAISERPGMPARWEVRKDDTAPSPPNVLAEIASREAGERFPMAILGNLSVTDGDLSVKMKPVGGRTYRGGGLVWRYRDPGNYYLLQANSRANELTVYRVEGGRRFPLALKDAPSQTFSVKHPVPPNYWSVLKVQFRGPLFSVYVNHRRLFQVRDWTFHQPGKVGLWARDDSVTYFDDFSVAGK